MGLDRGAGTPGQRALSAGARAFEVVAYRADWPEAFERERVRIAEAFGSTSIEIEHVGSTAVPGLAAKPIIDILVGAHDLPTIEARIPAMVALGYEYVPDYERELPERRYFRRPRSRPRSHHVHGVVLGGDLWLRHLRFRDRLRAHREERDAYAALKLDLAVRHRNDRPAYTEAKGPFITRILERADP